MPETTVSAPSQSGISLIESDREIAEYRLDCNGLKILLSENHAAPVVTLMVLYRVGSRNEGAGFTGATHFLEHMMFKGTDEYNPEQGRGIDDVLKPMGAAYNATTWFDRTNYFECVPSVHLEQCIAIEADRMRNLNLKQSDRDLEMTVVRNEFERSENEPDDVLDKEFWAIAFREHPYHWPTIGWKSEVEGVPISKLKDFYDTFYWPNNAVVLLVGDFETEPALSLIAKYFGKLTASPHPIPTVYTVEPPQEGERRFEVSRAGDLPRVGIGFHTPQATHPDIYALSAMSAILGGGRRSTRLYKRLVDTSMVSSVSAHLWELYDPALFEVSATVSPDAEPKEVEKIVLEEINKLVKEPPTKEELDRAKKANRKSTILQSADPLVWAQMIAEAEAAADWKWLLSYDDRFDEVTPADIQKVAAKYFARENRTVGYFIPKESDS
jgi:zinc protease